MVKKKKVSEPSWDKIGAMIGKKMEKGFKGGECCGPWWKWADRGYSNRDNGFVGRVLFIVGLYIALNTLGLLHGIATWVIVMMGIGFALMRF